MKIICQHKLFVGSGYSGKCAQCGEPFFVTRREDGTIMQVERMQPPPSSYIPPSDLAPDANK